MPRFRPSLAMTVLLILAAPAGAAIPYQQFQPSAADMERLTSTDHQGCVDESGGVTSELRDCADAEHHRLDQRLNATYREAMRRLADAPARLRLRELERRWIATRWDECRREAQLEGGGTLAMIILDGCVLHETTRRVAWLEQYGRP